MDKSIKCDCGNNKLWWFLGYLRCPQCFTEFRVKRLEIEYREYDKKENGYLKWKNYNLRDPQLIKP